MTASHSVERLERAQKFIVERIRSSPDLLEIVDHVFDFALSYCFGDGIEDTEWLKKTPNLMALCGNCNYKWVAGFSGTPTTEQQALLARTAVCIRCLEGELIRYFEISSSNPSSRSSVGPIAIPVFKHTEWAGKPSSRVCSQISRPQPNIQGRHHRNE